MTALQVASRYSGKSLLLTGASGYIGTLVLGLLRDVDCTVRAVVRPERVSEQGEALAAIGPRRLEVIGHDFRTGGDLGGLLSGIDVVVHLAAQTSHYEADAHPSEDLAINVLPVLRLLECCRDRGISPRFVFASSATVVGLPKTLPVDEQAPCEPITIYDIHKLCSEQYLAHFARAHGIPSCSLRLANVYGTSTATAKPQRGIVNQMVKRALAGEDLTVFGSGDWLRDYVHVRDVALAFLHAGVADEARITGRAFNVCSGTGTRFRDVLRMIIEQARELTGLEAKIVHVDKKLTPIDERSYVGSPKALADAAGWIAKIDLRAGIAELLAASG